MSNEDKRLASLRKRIEEEKKLKREEFGKLPEDRGTIDLDKVESIVKRMKKKYAASGVEEGELKEGLSELRGAIAEGKTKVKIQTIENLKDFKSPTISGIGKMYSSLKAFFGPLQKLISKMPGVKDLDYYMYSANMKYSPAQFLSLTTVVSVFSSLFLLVLLLVFLVGILKMNTMVAVVASVLLSGIGFVFIALLVLYIPKSNARKRAELLNVELPFALRHMGTELRAGIGLYKTLQTIATADYGVLSEEFARTINEIEEGTDTKEALRHFASRTQSKALRSSLLHVIRALKTGGNLSDIMNTIAEDVSFELRMKMRDFAEKMNFFGVIFIFGAIVLPVFIAILGAIANAPLGGAGVSFSSIPLDPTNMTMIYLVVMPLVLAVLIYYLFISQPKV